jgi:hypothetical protein
LEKNDMLRIAIVTGSTRPGRNNEAVTKSVYDPPAYDEARAAMIMSATQTEKTTKLGAGGPEVFPIN